MKYLLIFDGNKCLVSVSSYVTGTRPSQWNDDATGTLTMMWEHFLVMSPRSP